MVFKYYALFSKIVYLCSFEETFISNFDWMRTLVATGEKPKDPPPPEIMPFKL